MDVSVPFFPLEVEDSISVDVDGARLWVRRADLDLAVEEAFTRAEEEAPPAPEPPAPVVVPVRFGVDLKGRGPVGFAPSVLTVSGGRSAWVAEEDLKGAARAALKQLAANLDGGG